MNHLFNSLWTQVANHFQKVILYWNNLYLNCTDLVHTMQANGLEVVSINDCDYRIFGRLCDYDITQVGVKQFYTNHLAQKLHKTKLGDFYIVINLDRTTLYVVLVLFDYLKEIRIPFDPTNHTHSHLWSLIKLEQIVQDFFQQIL